MSKPAFTPGPWLVPHFADNCHPCDCKVVVSGSHLGGICEVFVDNGLPIRGGGNDCPPLEQARANAHLIAAALDMYGALRGVVRILDAVRHTAGLSGNQLDRLERARIALAKAEGRAA